MTLKLDNTILIKLVKSRKSTRTAIAENNLVKIGNYMNEAQSHLSASGISHPKLDELINAASCRCSRAKLTVGGVGGTMIALTTNGEQTTRVIKALEDAGAQEVWTQNYTNNK